MIRRCFLYSFLTLWLSACASLPAKHAALNEHLSWAQRQQQLRPIQTWTVRGEIGGYTDKQHFSASVVWQQEKQHYEMHLFGPLGTGMTQLAGKPNHVILITSNHQHYQATNAEALLQQTLGWSLPVSNLYYWIRGLPAPQTPSQVKFDQYHHLTLLKQQGWVIRYLQYTGVNNKVDLPSQITLTRQDLHLKIIISLWQLK